MADTRKEQGRHQAQAPAAQATLRLYEELNDYLPRELRKRDVAVRFSPPAPVRHLIETLGVPHTEVELILINGDSVGLETSVDDGDRIAVYPVFESLDVSPLLRVRERPCDRPVSSPTHNSVGLRATCACWDSTPCMKTIPATRPWSVSRANNGGSS